MLERAPWSNRRLRKNGRRGSSIDSSGAGIKRITVEIDNSRGKGGRILEEEWAGRRGSIVEDPRGLVSPKSAGANAGRKTPKRLKEERTVADPSRSSGYMMSNTAVDYGLRRGKLQLRRYRRFDSTRSHLHRSRAAVGEGEGEKSVFRGRNLCGTSFSMRA